MSFNTIRENKIIAKICEFTVVFPSLKSVFVIAESVDPDEMLRYHSLSMFSFGSQQYRT